MGGNGLRALEVRRESPVSLPRMDGSTAHFDAAFEIIGDGVEITRDPEQVRALGVDDDDVGLSVGNGHAGRARCIERAATLRRARIGPQVIAMEKAWAGRGHQRSISAFAFSSRHRSAPK